MAMPHPPKPLSLTAPAKINLVLRVGPVDPGTGYHPLGTWMCTVGLFDRLRFAGAPGAGPPGLAQLVCDDPSLPRDAGNLVVRAASALCAAAGIDPSRLRIELKKRIPAAAGLGGGSSDAAATLLGLNEMLSLDRGRDELCAIAARLGADVPFFVEGGRTGGSAWCTGRGERISPANAPTRARVALLVLPRHVALSTAAVYRRFDDLGLGRDENLEEGPDPAALAGLGAREMLPRLRNDLEAAAFSLSDELSGMREAVERALRRPVRMSGSGSALYTLYDAVGPAAAGVGARDDRGEGMEGDEGNPELAEAVAAAGKAVAPSAARIVVVPVCPDVRQETAMDAPECESGR